MWATPSFSTRFVIGSSLSPSLRPDSIGTKFGGKPGNKPGGKKPFKPYNSTEKKNRPGKGGDAGKKQNKFVVSKAGNVQQKRKLPFKGKKEGGEGEGEKTCATLQCCLSWFSLHVSSLLNILGEVILSVNRRERVNYDQHYVLMRGNDDHMPVVSCQPCQKTQY